MTASPSRYEVIMRARECVALGQWLAAAAVRRIHGERHDVEALRARLRELDDNAETMVEVMLLNWAPTTPALVAAWRWQAHWWR